MFGLVLGGRCGTVFSRSTLLSVLPEQIDKPFVHIVTVACTSHATRGGDCLHRRQPRRSDSSYVVAPFPLLPFPKSVCRCWENLSAARKRFCCNSANSTNR